MDKSLSLARQTLKVWQVLVSRAISPVIVSYENLASMTCIPLSELHKPLNIVKKYCSEKQLPPITMILEFSNNDVNIPDHIWFFTNRHVRGFDWWGILPVESGDFEEIIRNAYISRN